MNARPHSRRFSLLPALALAALASAPAFADTPPDALERGISAYSQERFEEAYELLKPIAVEGDAEAQYRVAQMYGRPSLGGQDFGKAKVWLERAAKEKHPNAILGLGYMYSNGMGVKEDNHRAAEYYSDAAELGNKVAQRNLGLLYKNGEGVERDHERAAEWFRRAAEQGDGTAAMELGRAYRHGRGVGQDFDEAAYWNRKAMRAGYESAQRLLAWQYFAGKGVDQDLEEAELLYRDLVEGDADDVDAQFALGLLLQKRGQDEDDEDHLAEAYEWLRKAASHGDAQAMLHVGAHHSNGWGVERDNVEAQAWAMLSEAHGNTEARGLIEHTTRYAHDADPERAETRASEIARELGLD